MEINKLNARTYSRLGHSGSVFGMGLLDLIKENPELLVLSSDMSRPAGLDRFKTQYPGNFYNVGIAEQNLVGIAAGLASEGKQVIVTAQAAFLSMRSCEQVRQYLGYMNFNIIAIGISAGFALTFFGNTHYAIEDMSVIHAMPGITILSPSDAGQACKALFAAVKLNKPVYMRLTGTLNNPVVYTEDYDFVIGKSIQIKEGKDITVFATGNMVYQAMQAVELLKEKGLSIGVTDIHTIKPLDTEAISKNFNSKLLVSIEEHSILGGLGGIISEFLAGEIKTPPLLRLGVKDTYSAPGDYSYLLKQHRLTPELIAEDILEKYNQLCK